MLQFGSNGKSDFVLNVRREQSDAPVHCVQAVREDVWGRVDLLLLGSAEVDEARVGRIEARGSVSVVQLSVVGTTDTSIELVVDPLVGPESRDAMHIAVTNE